MKYIPYIVVSFLIVILIFFYIYKTRTSICQGTWGDCSVECTDDGIGGVREKIKSKDDNSDCEFEQGITMSETCNVGEICDCEGSWDISKCQSNGNDVVCGESQRTYTFNKTSGGNSKCLENYGDEIPEYLRGNLGDTLIDSSIVIEECSGDEAVIDGETMYTSKQCNDCNINEYVSVNRTCNQCPYGTKVSIPKDPEETIQPDTCTPKKCNEWYSDNYSASVTNSPCGDVTKKYNVNNEEGDGYDELSCCIDRTCNDWYNDNYDESNPNSLCGEGKEYNIERSDLRPGGIDNNLVCCKSKTCGEWYSDKQLLDNPCDNTAKKYDINKAGELGYDPDTCCITKTCGDWHDFATNYDYFANNVCNDPDKIYVLEKEQDVVVGIDGYFSNCCELNPSPPPVEEVVPEEPQPVEGGLTCGSISFDWGGIDLCEVYFNGRSGVYVEANENVAITDISQYESACCSNP